MKTQIITIALLLFILLAAGAVFAGDLPGRSRSLIDLDQGFPQPEGKASRDTVVLIGPWGSGAQANGQFEDELGNPAWNGWTHEDITQSSTSHWHISDYQAELLGLNPGPDNLAAWCGNPNIPACSEDDLAGGYGNNWHDLIEWIGAVDDNSIGVNVHFTAHANIDSEPGYDVTSIKYLTDEGPEYAVFYDGYLPNEFIDVSFTLSPDDYQGEAQNQVVIQVKFQSDGGWSDADCQWSTEGAVQIDDITVTLNQGGADIVSFTDFQDGMGDWAVTFPEGVGDFTQLWDNLDEVDPCKTNFSPQAAFIDDGLVVPGAGPSYCIDWCYGPGGYIVNTTGGLAGPDSHLHNAVVSPVVDWPGDEYNGSLINFDIFLHEDLSADSPGIFGAWSVRSADSVDEFGNPTGSTIEGAPWVDSNWVYYGAPQYYRAALSINGLMVPGRDQVQIRLECYELGYVWGFVGNDGYPAPYYDNVRLLAFQTYGPFGGYSEQSLANDNFPAIGEVDLVNLGNNSVRFDKALTYVDEVTGLPTAVDNITFEMRPLRLGAELAGHPEVHFLVKQNPLFDDFRTNPEFGSDASGIVLADTARNASGVVPGVWAFDLPDSNFLFPGDVIHYFFTGTDGGGPGGLPWETVTVPADTSGFTDFTGPRSYDNAFTMRALPSIFEDPFNPGQLVTPKALLWADDRHWSFPEWFGAFNNLGLVCGRDYDLYYTNGPGNGNGNGIGGRATPYSLIGYDEFIYSAEAFFAFTLSEGDLVDPGNDIGVLDAWLRLGNRDLFMTGDSFITDIMINCGTPGVQFVEDWIKVIHHGSDIRPLIGNQATPLVKPVAGNGVYQEDLTWVAYGGCQGINTFDALEADQNNGGIRLAEFLSPAGSSAYSYSAATLYQDADTGSRVITMPYGFSFINTGASGEKVNAPLAARVRVLEQTLGFFGLEGDPLDVTPVPVAPRFAVRNYPNPFNPSTKIEYTLAKPGPLSLKVFNLRGELVKTLIDEVIESSGFVIWDGTDSQDAQVASGVYFYEARTGGEVKVEKMVMIK